MHNGKWQKWGREILSQCPKPVLEKAKKRPNKRHRTSQKVQGPAALWTSENRHNGGSEKHLAPLLPKQHVYSLAVKQQVSGLGCEAQLKMGYCISKLWLCSSYPKTQRLKRASHPPEEEPGPVHMAAEWFQQQKGQATKQKHSLFKPLMACHLVTSHWQNTSHNQAQSQRNTATCSRHFFPVYHRHYAENGGYVPNNDRRLLALFSYLAPGTQAAMHTPPERALGSLLWETWPARGKKKMIWH